MLKRIFSLVIVCVLACSLMPAAIVYAADKSEIQLLADLGIIDVTEAAELLPDTFTREEFAVALNKLDRNIENFITDGEEEGKYATDIKGNKNYGHIATLIALGYMETDANNNFRPSQPVSRMDVVRALIHALSYDIIAENDGGTDAAYDRIANKLGLLKGVRIQNASKLTPTEVASILANAMSIRFFPPENVDFGDECFYTRWGIVKRTGKILANSSLGLAIPRTELKHVNIGGKEYYTSLLIADELVGSDVEYYTLQGDWGEEVVSIYINKNNSDNITINANDIESVTESAREITITYDKKKKITISKSAFALVNGKTIDPTKQLFDAFKSGTATFIKSGNGYNVVHITMMVQGVIDGVNVNNKSLSLRWYNQKIDLEEIENYEIYLGKKVSDISALSAGMVVGVACDSFTLSAGRITYDFSKADYVRLYASQKLASGRVDAMGDDTVTINDIEYPIGPGYEQLVSDGHFPPLMLGKYVNAYMDKFGELLYYEIDEEKSALSYGYLIKAGVGGSGIKKTTMVKIMDKNGVFHLLDTDKKFVLDGQKVDSGSTTYLVGSTTVNLNTRQVVRYRAEDGVLKEIDTKTLRASTEIKEGSLTEDIAFDRYAESQTQSRVSSGVIDRKTVVTDETVIFIDESLSTDTDPEDYNFSVSTKDAFKKINYLAAYDINEYGETGCVVRYDSYGMTQSNATAQSLVYAAYGMVVEKVRNAINADGEEGYLLYLTDNQNKVVYFAKTETLKLYEAEAGNKTVWEEYITLNKVDSNQLENTVKPGDVIRITTNAKDEIIYIEKIFDFAYHKNSYTVAEWEGGQAYGFAKVEKVIGDFIVFSYGDVDNTKYFVRKRSSRYDTLPVYYTGSKTTENVAFSDIPSAATGNDAKIFLRYYNYGEAMDYIVYVFDE